MHAPLIVFSLSALPQTHGIIHAGLPTLHRLRGEEVVHHLLNRIRAFGQADDVWPVLQHQPGCDLGMRRAESFQVVADVTPDVDDYWCVLDR